MEKPYREHNFYGSGSIQPEKDEIKQESEPMPQSSLPQESIVEQNIEQPVVEEMPVMEQEEETSGPNKPEQLTGLLKRLPFIEIGIGLLGLVSIGYGVTKASEYGWLTAKDSPIFLGYMIYLWGISVVPIFLILGTLCIVAATLRIWSANK